LNVPKVLEITLNRGMDPVGGKMAGIDCGDPREWDNFEQLYEAFLKQLNFIVETKVKVSNYIDRMFAKNAPAPFLSVVIDDCIAKGRDYYNGGPRYNTNYIQCTGLGTVTDSLMALRKHVLESNKYSWTEMLDALAYNFQGDEKMRQFILNRTPFFGNDDEEADALAVRIYDDLFKAIDGRPNTKGESFHLNMLSTTCHIYFGLVLGASANGRQAQKSISDGTSPSHGADTNGPTAVIRSLGKLDQSKSGGTLLNLRFLPSLLKRDEDIKKLGQLIRSYFSIGGHHVQFNVVDSATLYAAQKHPEEYKDLLVRMAGYSDYFNDMNIDLQQEIIDRTENESL
jgi:trans-4-hydroxy-L-proline dehydratase